jgi:hypothetical protein
MHAPPLAHESPAPHGVPKATKLSPGQTLLVPLQTSATSHGLTLGRHDAPTPRTVHMPFADAPRAVEQAWHAPALQASLQQTPSTQNPDPH